MILWIQILLALSLGLTAAPRRPYCFQSLLNASQYLYFPPFDDSLALRSEALLILKGMKTRYQRLGYWRIPSQSELEEVTPSFRLERFYRKFDSRKTALLALKQIGLEEGIPVLVHTAEWDKEEIDENLRAHFKEELIWATLNFIRSHGGRFPAGEDFTWVNGLTFDIDRLYGTNEFRKATYQKKAGRYAEKRAFDSQLEAITHLIYRAEQEQLKIRLFHVRWVHSRPSEYIRQYMLRVADDLVIEWAKKNQGKLPGTRQFGTGHSKLVGVTFEQYVSRGQKYKVGGPLHSRALHRTIDEARESLQKRLEERGLSRLIDWEGSSSIWQ